MCLRINLLSLCALCALCGESLPQEPGALVIVGGGKIPDGVRAEFVRLAGGKGKARIVVIPTASIDADKPEEADGYLKPWKDLGPASVVLLHTRDRKTADDPAFVKPLTGATGVWLSGGDQNRLVDAYAGTKALAEVKAVVGRGGVAGGTSAGAAAVSDLMIQGGTTEAKTGPGLGLLPGVVVDQHFTQRKRIDRLRGVIAENPTSVGLGVDESTAAVVRGRSVKVIGEGTVTVVKANPAREDVLKAGGTAELPEPAAKK